MALRKGPIMGKQNEQLLNSLRGITVDKTPGECKLGQIANTLDKETQEALFSALRSAAPTTGILASLTDAGFTISRSTLTQKRISCFKDNGHKCLCFPNNGDK